MGSRRTIIVVAAVVLAALAGVATYSYLSTVQDRANKGARLVKVFVVKKDIARGVSGNDAIEQGLIKEAEINEKFRPATALTSLDPIKGKVAITNLAANLVLVDGLFVDPRVEQITFAKQIPPGQVAITVSVDQVHGVAGLLVPGDQVGIIVTDPRDASKRFLFQNVKILAIGGATAPQPGETTQVTNPGSGLITFSVPALAAEKIALAAESGGLYLVLVPPDNQPQPVPPVNIDNLFQGGLTPYE